MKKNKTVKTSLGSLLAQSAAELAIFGSIVMFVIGIIMRSGLNSSQNIDQQLRAFRKALLESYKTSYGFYGEDFAASRLMASVMIVEDRLVVDPTQKQGTRDRTPLMSQGTGMMTRMLFYPKDHNEASNISFFDVYINGQHFPFTTNRFITYRYAYNDKASTVTVSGGSRGAFTARKCSVAIKPDEDDPINPGQTLSPFNSSADWKREAANRTICSFTSGGQVFLRLYRQKVNANDDDWSTTDDWRFDLDLDGKVDVAGTDTYTAPNGTKTDIREHFSWQWDRTAATSGNVNVNNSFDFDGDWDEETAQSISGAGRLTAVTVLDNNEGDVDFSHIEHEVTGEPSVGLGREARMLSYTKGPNANMAQGTYLFNQEGKLYTVDEQFVRNETRQDQLDLIERVFYLSNNTTRFCHNGAPRDWGALNDAQRRTLAIPPGLQNPVERCVNDCYATAPIMRRTCYDLDANAIFIRSRIEDKRRTSWVTRAFTGDE